MISSTDTDSVKKKKKTKNIILPPFIIISVEYCLSDLYKHLKHDEITVTNLRTRYSETIFAFRIAME